MRPTRILLVTVLGFTLACSAFAFEIEGIDLRLGYVYTFNEYRGQGSVSEPLDTYAGIGLPLRLTPIPIGLGLTIDVTYREYLVTSDGPVVPTQIETGADAGVGVGGALGLFFGAPVSLSVKPLETLTLAVGGSPTVFLRLPVRSIEGDTSAMKPYFLDRLFFPEAFLSTVYDYSENWSFGFSGRWLIPVFNANLETTLPFRDQMMIGVHLTIRRQF